MRPGESPARGIVSGPMKSGTVRESAAIAAPPLLVGDLDRKRDGRGRSRVGDRDINDGGVRGRFRNFNRDRRLVAKERAVDVADDDGAATASAALLRGGRGAASAATAAARAVDARCRGDGPIGTVAAVLPTRRHRIGVRLRAAAAARTVDDRLASDGACISRSARA